MYHRSFIHLLNEGHLSCLQGLVIIDKLAINIYFQVCFCFVFLVWFVVVIWDTFSNIWGKFQVSAFYHMKKSTRSFLRNCQNVFRSGCAIVYSHQQWIFLFLHILSVLSIVSVLHFSYNKCVVIYCSIIIFQMMDNVEHRLICLFSIWISLLLRCLWNYVAHLLVGSLFIFSYTS